MNIFRIWKTMSKARKARIKKKGFIISFLSFGASCFGLGYGLKEPIQEAFEGKPELVWGLTSTGIVVVMALIIFWGVRRVTRPMREKRKLRQLEQAKLEHELETIAENKKKQEEEELENDKDIKQSNTGK